MPKPSMRQQVAGQQFVEDKHVKLFHRGLELLVMNSRRLGLLEPGIGAVRDKTIMGTIFSNKNKLALAVWYPNAHGRSSHIPLFLLCPGQEMLYCPTGVMDARGFIIRAIGEIDKMTIFAASTDSFAPVMAIADELKKSGGSCRSVPLPQNITVKDEFRKTSITLFASALVPC